MTSNRPGLYLANGMAWQATYSQWRYVNTDSRINGTRNVNWIYNNAVYDESGVRRARGGAGVTCRRAWPAAGAAHSATRARARHILTPLIVTWPGLPDVWIYKNCRTSANIWGQIDINWFYQKLKLESQFYCSSNFRKDKTQVGFIFWKLLLTFY